jgi:asparagine synthase (glutamine-hydrolysing)
VLNETEKFALYTPDWAEYLRQSPDFNSTDDFLANFFPASAPNRLARWLYFDLHTTLANEMLAKVDKATMAWGLEARNPFLDYRLVEYALTLPPHLMAQGTEGKRLLKRLGERHVPATVLYRPKQGFVVPLESWFRDRLPSPLNAALAKERLDDTGVFQSDVVSQIITRHQGDRRADLSHAIFVLAWFEMWQAGA